MREKDWMYPIIESVRQSKRKAFEGAVEELQPYDLSEVYCVLETEDRETFLDYLGPDLVVDLVQELENGDRIDVLGRSNPDKLTYILNKMDNDDLADLLDDIPLEKKNEWLESMNKKEAKSVQKVLNYAPETAGRIMTDKFIQVSQTSTVIQAVQKMKKYAAYSETINYLYVVDEEKRLVGVVSHRDLILSEPHEKLADIMYTRVISTHVKTDQEEVAMIIERYDFLALPVVEEEGKLVGIITVDDAMDVLIKEANEDFEKMGATGKDIVFETKAYIATFRRLPWLLLLLLIGIFTGSIVSRFDGTIERVVTLTYFMPLMAGMTGNTGTQSLALAIRGIAQGKVDKHVFRKLLLRELAVGLMIGIVCGTAIGIIVYAWQGNVALAVVISVSLLVSLIMGTLVGTVIPFFLHLCKIDPAVASGPLITTLNDVFSLCVYFGLATLFLERLL